MPRYRKVVSRTQEMSVFVKDSLTLVPRLQADQCRAQLAEVIRDMEKAQTQYHSDDFVMALLVSAGINPLPYHFIRLSPNDGFTQGWRRRQEHQDNLDKLRKEYLAYLKERLKSPEKYKREKDPLLRRLVKGEQRSVAAEERWEGILLTLAYFRKFDTFLSYKRCTNITHMCDVILCALDADGALLQAASAGNGGKKIEPGSWNGVKDMFRNVKSAPVDTVADRAAKIKLWQVAEKGLMDVWGR